MSNIHKGLRDRFGIEVKACADYDSLFIDPRAIYVASMDCVEYVSKDVTLVSDRIDEFLTIHWDREQAEVIGFKLKGFRHYFETVLKPEFADSDFIPLVKALEKHLTVKGRQIFPASDAESKVQQGYAEARALAERDNVGLSESSLRAA